LRHWSGIGTVRATKHESRNAFLESGVKSMDDLAAQGGVEGVAAAELRQFIERIERLEEEPRCRTTSRK
jgi:hypothetical protein